MYLKLDTSGKTLLKEKFKIKLILPKLATVLINLVKLGPRIILRSTMQLLRANIWVRIVSTIVMLLVDVVRYFTGKISKKQFVLDVALSLSLLVGGTAGWYAGTNAVLGVVAENTIVWIIAGILGAGVLGAVLEYVAKFSLTRFITPDVEDILQVFNRQFEIFVNHYSLSADQALLISKEICIDSKVCLMCFKAVDRDVYAKGLLEPYFSKYVSDL